MGKQLLLNPNWAQLQQKLQTQSSKSSNPSLNLEKETRKSSLGKRKERSEDETKDARSSVLIPINDKCSLTDALAMDCEMVGVSSLGNKSALGHVTLVNAWGNVVYDEYVRPIERVVDFRTEISGIRPRDLRKAKDFRVAQKEVADMIKGRLLVGHALRNDLRALLLSHPKYDVRDTAEYRLFLKGGRRRSLRGLASEFLGVKIQHGEHCPIEDARAAMLLYQRHKKEWEKGIDGQVRIKQRKQKKKSRDREAANMEKS